MTATPCANDPRWISEGNHRADKQDRLDAAGLCLGCPVFDECQEAYFGERWNVVAGELPNGLARTVFRAGIDRKTQCRNGHPLEEYGVLLEEESSGHRAEWGCRRCTDLQKYIADPERPAQPPVTVPNKALPIRHGTVGGFAAHEAEGEEPCHKCHRAQRVAEAQEDVA